MKCAKILRNFNGSIEARNPQSQSLQNVEDLRMHYVIGGFEYYGKLNVGFEKHDHSQKISR